MTDEITETVKAVQEVAKVTGQGIQAAEKVGSFFSRVMSESIDATCGMIADTLKFQRWKNQVRLIEKCESIIEKRNISGKTRVVPPKLALPILQSASVEDEDTLHSMWANLLVAAMDPAIDSPRTAFIEIIKQLDPVDVKILKNIFDIYQSKEKDTDSSYATNVYYKKWWDSTQFEVLKDEIINNLQIKEMQYKISTDNLIRLRLIEPFFEDGYIEKEINGVLYDDSKFSFYHGSGKVCITCLGVAFVQACIEISI